MSIMYALVLQIGKTKCFADKILIRVNLFVLVFIRVPNYSLKRLTLTTCVYFNGTVNLL